HRLFTFGWHELRAGGRVAGETEVAYVDEIPLADHLRIGFGLDKYTRRVASLSLEFRYSLLRDKVKVGVFNDVGVWRHLPRDDAAVRSVRGDPDDPFSQGHLCPKAAAIPDVQGDPDRIREPQRREGGSWRAVSWKAALDEAGERLAAVQRKYGKSAVGVYLGN